MIQKAIKESYKIFDEFNRNFYNNKLVTPIILIQSKTKKYILGTCSNHPIWNNKTKDKDKRYEITLSGEYLNRTIDEIVTTILHEMVHLYCSLNNIKDTSNNGVYHNKKFKQEGEERGLIIKKEKTIGWSVTTLKPETKNLIKKFKINDKAFEYYRKSITNLSKNPKKKIYKYMCETCGLKISHYKPVNLICGICNKKLVERD